MDPSAARAVGAPSTSSPSPCWRSSRGWCSGRGTWSGPPPVPRSRPSRRPRRCSTASGWCPGVLGMLVVRRPGAALATAFLAAAVSWLLGAWWGLSVLWYGVLQGLAPELVFASLRYRSFGRTASIAAGAAAGAVPGLLDPIFWYPEWTAGGRSPTCWPASRRQRSSPGSARGPWHDAWRAPASSTPSRSAGSASASRGRPSMGDAAGARITALGWGFRYPGRSAVALSDVSFTIEPGRAGGPDGRLGVGQVDVAGGTGRDAARGWGLREPPGRGPRGRRSSARIGLVQQEPEGNIVMERVGDDVAFPLENAAVPAGADLVGRCGCAGRCGVGRTPGSRHLEAQRRTAAAARRGRSHRRRSAPAAARRAHGEPRPGRRPPRSLRRSRWCGRPMAARSSSSSTGSRPGCRAPTACCSPRVARC